MFWDGIATGDATSAPYDAPTEFAGVLLAMMGIRANSGRVFVTDGSLLVTGTVTPVSVASGQSIVYGNWYKNTAAVTVVIPTPAGATRIDRIVLRKDWSAQTVRITRIAGVEGGAAPALVQVAGTTWDIPLAQASITTGGVITVVNEQEVASIPVIRRKTATVTIQSDDSLNDDSELWYWMAANEVVHFRLCIHYTSDATADFLAAFSVPAGGAIVQASTLKNGSAGALDQINTNDGTISGNNGVDGQYFVLVSEGKVVNGATPGRLQFRWSQRTSNASNTSVLLNSILEVTPIL